MKMKEKEKIPKKQVVPGDWLYMTEQEIKLRRLKEIFTENDPFEVEFWEEAGVLEVMMPDGNSVDIETAQIHPKDVLTQTFADAHQVKTVFLVTFKPECYEDAKKIMDKILGETGGFFCGDTENFEPMYR